MVIKKDIHLLSVNQAWQGRRFKTKEYKDYERDLLLTLPKQKMIKGEVEISLFFFFKNDKKRDIDNCVKPLLDILVKRGYFEDDRKIRVMHIHKYKRAEDGFQVIIRPYVEDNC